MEEKLSVQMTKEALFDFLLYHTYSKFSGFLTNVLGAAVGIMGIILLAMGRIKPAYLVFYLVAAAAFIAFTPLQLKHRAKKQMELNEEYKTEWEYTFNEHGITAVRGDKVEEVPWEMIERVATTPKTIGIYYGKDHAFIIPKQAFGSRFVAVMKMIAQHIDPQKVRLR
ncbi:YcxB family protein [Extibacter muris]|uniref:YcxB family protein n=1 Tax=Extibacter muris TaxID=1796622 RepID=UPI001D09372A|nr:YcxB family protein [Extibacter muris]MCB6202491.1 YcxB family protein [Extibacter muris]MCQ4664360.1 YcxB family protein [Extibacter muris]MCQ4693569.1 YcxB family protein [Extibacter muris]